MLIHSCLLQLTQISIVGMPCKPVVPTSRKIFMLRGNGSHLHIIHFAKMFPNT